MADSKMPDTTTIGNVLGGVALAFLVDRLAMSGAVTKALPAEFVAFVGFLVFAGVALYGYKVLKRTN